MFVFTIEIGIEMGLFFKFVLDDRVGEIDCAFRTGPHLFSSPNSHTSPYDSKFTNGALNR